MGLIEFAFTVQQQELSHPFLAKADQVFRRLKIRVGGSLQYQVLYNVGGFSGPCRPHMKGVWGGDWNSTNARDFIKYSVSKGYQIDSWEFDEKPMLIHLCDCLFKETSNLFSTIGEVLPLVDNEGAEECKR
nr:hypothetical protein [Tanacetum cinerariifolium]